MTPCHLDDYAAKASAMLKTRMKRLAQRSEQAVQHLAAIKASITGLGDDDLLDMADIFKAEPDNPLGAIAFEEMKRRNIRL